MFYYVFITVCVDLLIDVFSCKAARVSNKLTYLLTYLIVLSVNCVYR